ncbi:hypothetical protein BDW75DRAFT_115958 [Aspergillus navahoensis]
MQCRRACLLVLASLSMEGLSALTFVYQTSKVLVPQQPGMESAAVQFQDENLDCGLGTYCDTSDLLEISTFIVH